MLIVVFIILLFLLRLFGCIHRERREYIAWNDWVAAFNNRFGLEQGELHAYNLSEITKSQWLVIGIKSMLDGDKYERMY